MARRLAGRVARNSYRLLGPAWVHGWLRWLHAMSNVAMEAAITDVYSELFAGEVTPFINATATYTVNGGSRMLPEVANSMHSANLSHVSLPALNHAASQTIAGLLQVPAAMVTSGASGAIALASAACCVDTAEHFPEKGFCIAPRRKRLAQGTVRFEIAAVQARARWREAQ